MRYSRSDLLQLKDLHLTFDENLTFVDDLSKPFGRIRRIDSVNVKGDGKYDPEVQHLNIHLWIKGTVIVGCDISGEDVTVPVEIDDDVIYSFNKKEEDIDIVKSEGEYINLYPTVFQLILLDLPTKVVKEGLTEYPSGDGWEVLSEDALEKSLKHSDPRLEVLKNYKPQ